MYNYECTHTLSGHFTAVFALKAIAGGRLASGAADNTIKMWNVDESTCECVRTLQGHTNAVVALDLLHGSGNGTLISRSTDGTIKYWNAMSGECTRTLTKANGRFKSHYFTWL